MLGSAARFTPFARPMATTPSSHIGVRMVVPGGVASAVAGGRMSSGVARAMQTARSAHAAAALRTYSQRGGVATTVARRFNTMVPPPPPLPGVAAEGAGAVAAAPATKSSKVSRRVWQLLGLGFVYVAIQMPAHINDLSESSSGHEELQDKHCKFVTIDDVGAVMIRDVGEGPVVILSMGTVLRAMPLQDELSKFCRVIAIDHPNARFSTAAGLGRRIHDVATVYPHVLNHLNIDGPIVVVASTYSWMPAYEFSMNNRSFVGGMVLLDPFSPDKEEEIMPTRYGGRISEKQLTEQCIMRKRYIKFDWKHEIASVLTMNWRFRDIILQQIDMKRWWGSQIRTASHTLKALPNFKVVVGVPDENTESFIVSARFFQSVRIGPTPELTKESSFRVALWKKYAQSKVTTAPLATDTDLRVSAVVPIIRQVVEAVERQAQDSA